MSDSLHTRIAAVVREHQQGQEWGIPQDECECGWLSRTDEIDYADHLADAVIRELDLGIPCANTGCRMRQIARRHAESSSRLESE